VFVDVNTIHRDSFVQSLFLNYNIRYELFVSEKKHFNFNGNIALKIALISTPFVPVPPPLYGGTELFVSNLATELVLKGHDVFLFATGDSSVPGAKIGFGFETAQWPPNEETEKVHLEATLAWIQNLEKNGHHFDVVHWNTPMASELMQWSLAPLKTRSVVTIHNALDKQTMTLMKKSDSVHYVLISERQRELFLLKSHLQPASVKNIHVIHHGLDLNNYFPRTNIFYPEEDRFVCFLGRMSKEKGPDIAVRVARKAGMKLFLAGPVHEKDKGFYDKKVAPKIDKNVFPLGEVGGMKKVAVLHASEALLFPIQWEEPFGLVMIEAMLCGTPVVAFNRGSVPEIVENGVTGFVVKDEKEMIYIIENDLPKLNRRIVMERAIQRFSGERMAEKYVELYAHIIPSR
jgi:glycosyltransferase involved in cell wall biosynthesis